MARRVEEVDAPAAVLVVDLAGPGPLRVGPVVTALLGDLRAPGTYAREVNGAATECLVSGSDTEALREPAGASPRDSRFLLDPLGLTTVEDLGVSDALEPDLQLSAVLVHARRLKAARVAPRELAAWAHSRIGHDGSVECQPFVHLDDMYGDAGYLGYEEAELDTMVRQEVEALLTRNAPGRSADSTAVSHAVRRNMHRM
ncbi:hypothetical protein IF650_01445 [Cellulosimicrobium terreum]|nr:hypothetical protein [Cellulosimicrobium terreum]